MDESLGQVLLQPKCKSGKIGTLANNSSSLKCATLLCSTVAPCANPVAGDAQQKGVTLPPHRDPHTWLCSPAEVQSPLMDGKGVASGQTSPEDGYVPSVTAVSLYCFVENRTSLGKPDARLHHASCSACTFCGSCFLPLQLSVKCKCQQISALAVINCEEEKILSSFLIRVDQVDFSWTPLSQAGMKMNPIELSPCC